MPDKFIDQFFTPANILPLALLVVALVAMKYLPRWLAGVPYVPPIELKHKLEAEADVLVLDVRTPKEFTGRGGHIDGALNLPLDQLNERLAAISADLGDLAATTPVYVICRTANRSANAARTLRKTGFGEVKVVDGGMVRWIREGLPTVQ